MKDSLDRSCSDSAAHFPCSHKDCHAIFTSKSLLDFHSKYSHTRDGKRPSRSSDAAGAAASDTAYKITNTSACEVFVCDEKECIGKSGEKKRFKNFANLKQHYMRLHAKKLYSCKNCRKMFSEVSRKNRHESDCGLKLACSCGVAYHGKRGFLLHLKSSNHPCPEEHKKYLAVTQPRKPKVLRSTRARFPPKAPSTMPRLIVPKFCRHSAASNAGAPSTRKLLLPKLPVKAVPKSIGGRSCGRFIIDVTCPSKLSVAHDCSCIIGNVLPTIKPVSAVVLLGSDRVNPPVVAMPNQVANSAPQEQAEDSVMATPCTNGVLSKIPQVDWSIQNQQAQDFSCQTEEFLAWLDSESEKCTMQSRNENSTSTAYTQTFQGKGNEGMREQQRTVTQHETQTDDDWLSDLLQDSECFQSEVSNAESQTSFNLNQMNLIERLGANNIKSYCISGVPDSACDMQTQTGFLESMANVTTQTNCHPVLDADDSPFFNFVNDIHTQTDGPDGIVDALANTANTRTTRQCSDLLECFNIETQTESFMPNALEFSVTRT